MSEQKGNEFEPTLRHKRVRDRHIETIKAVIASPQVAQFVIGVSGQKSEIRYAQYRKAEFEHYVILSDSWSGLEALWLERELQDIFKTSRYSYSEEHRNDSHRNSLGGKKFDRYHVYLAWYS